MSALPYSTIEDAVQAWIVAGSGLASDHVVWSEQTAPRPQGEFISMRLTVLEQRGRDWFDRYDNFITFGPLTISGRSGNSLTITNHGRSTGDGPAQFANVGGALPAPLAALTNYWLVVIDANTVQVATTFQNAVAATPVVITLTSGGSGTNTVSSTPTTTRAGQEVAQRVRGPRHGLLQLECFAGAPTGGSATGATSPVAILHDAITAHCLESINAALVAAGVGVGAIEPIRSIDGVVNTVRFEPRAIAHVHLHLAAELVETSTYIQIVNITDNVPTPPVALPPIILP